MTTWTPTADDRDEQGRIKLPAPPRAIDPLAQTALPLPNASASPITPRSTSPRLLVAGVLAGLIVAAALIALISFALPVAPAARPTARATLAPSPVAAPPAPSPAPIAPAVVAFAAPGGDVLGPIDARQAYHFVARYGDAWLQADVPGSSRVWVRRADLRLDGDDLAAIAALPDLVPPTPAPAPALVVAPAAPAPTVEPEVCLKTDYGERCGPASQMQDQQQIASEIATASKEWSQAWLATATAEADRGP